MNYVEFHGYRVYKNGKVLNRYGKEISKRNHNGRYEVKLTVDGKRKNFILARLIYYLFVGFDVEDKNLCVVHKDGNNLNTHIDNLELVHRKDLIQGEKHRNRAKLTNKEVKEIRSLYKGKAGTNQFDKRGYSLQDLANMYGVSKENIKMIVDGKTYNEDNYRLK